MKTNSPTRPRLLCRVVRSWYSVTDPAAGGEARGGGTKSRHVAACADCRAYFAAGDELGSALRREAVAIREVAPVGLEHGIMQAIAAETRMAPARPAMRFSVAPLAFAGTAVAVFAIIFGVARWSKERERGAAAIDATRDLAAFAAAAEEFSDDWLNTKLPAAGVAAANNPLRQELDSLHADARSALNFLALNFLPSGTAGTETTRGSRSKG